MTVYLFAGIPVSDFAAALAWYERLLGSQPSFFPHDTEAVWQLAEHRVGVRRPAPGAGHALLTLIVDDLDERVTGIARRGLRRPGGTYPNDVRKITYADPEGNEIGFGEIPAE